MSSTNRGAERQPHDLYPTPAPPIDALLSVMRYSPLRHFHEPCKGTGAIYDRVQCLRKSYCEIAEGIDYLTHTPPHQYDLIITNPPFSLALEFLQKSLQEADTVCYLLRLNFLGSQKRRVFWQANRPSHVLVLPERPVFSWPCHGHSAKEKKQKGCGAMFLPEERKVCPICGGRVGPGTDSIEYAWFCWDRGGFVTLEPGVHVL